MQKTTPVVDWNMVSTYVEKYELIFLANNFRNRAAVSTIKGGYFVHDESVYSEMCIWNLAQTNAFLNFVRQNKTRGKTVLFVIHL